MANNKQFTGGGGGGGSLPSWPPAGFKNGFVQSQPGGHYLSAWNGPAQPQTHSVYDENYNHLFDASVTIIANNDGTISVTGGPGKFAGMSGTIPVIDPNKQFVQTIAGWDLVMNLDGTGSMSQTVDGELVTYSIALASNGPDDFEKRPNVVFTQDIGHNPQDDGQGMSPDDELGLGLLVAGCIILAIAAILIGGGWGVLAVAAALYIIGLVWIYTNPF